MVDFKKDIGNEVAGVLYLISAVVMSLTVGAYLLSGFFPILFPIPGFIYVAGLAVMVLGLPAAFIWSVISLSWFPKWTKFSVPDTTSSSILRGLAWVSFLIGLVAITCLGLTFAAFNNM